MMSQKQNSFLGTPSWLPSRKRTRKQSALPNGRPADTVTMKMQEIYAERDARAMPAGRTERIKIVSVIESVIADVMSSDIALKDA